MRLAIGILGTGSKMAGFFFWALVLIIAAVAGVQLLKRNIRNWAGFSFFVGFVAFVVACNSITSNPGGDSVSQATPSPSPDTVTSPQVAAVAAPTAMPAPKTVRWLQLRPGVKARLGQNGGDQWTWLDVFASAGDIERDGAPSIKRHHGDIVTVVAVAPTADLVSHTHAVKIQSDDGWSGWVNGEISLEPMPPAGTLLSMGPKIGNAVPTIYRRQSDNAGPGIDGGTRLRYLGFAKDPGNAEYRVRVLEGPRTGLVGYVLDSDLRAENGDAFMLSIAGNSFAEPSPTPEGKVVAHFDFGDIVVHHRYHVAEAFDDQTAANTLLGSRMAGNRSGIEEAYKDPGYHSYGGGESTPVCQVADQDPVDVIHDKDNIVSWNQPASAIACDMGDGTRVYVTGFSSENIANE